MKTSESITKLAEALLKAQTAIQGVTKDRTGKIVTKTGSSYEYKYSDLASVIEAVKPALNANGIIFLQCPGGDSAGVAVTTRLLHSSGEWLETTVYLPVSQGTAQAYGSAITYGKRYGLQSLVGLPSEDDDGSEASKERKKEAAELADDTATKIAISILLAAKNLDDLAGAWKALPQVMRDTKEVEEAKDKKKTDFLAAEEEHAATA
jgi:hypothetical protein